MAGTSQIVKSAWPHGEKSLIPLRFHWEHVAGDTSDFKIVGTHTAQFDFTVEKAEFMMREASWINGAAMAVKVIDDSASPQTIIAATTIDADSDAGVPVALTIADKGPILTDGILIVSFDSGDANGVVRDANVTIWVRPVYG